MDVFTLSELECYEFMSEKSKRRSQA